MRMQSQIGTVMRGSVGGLTFTAGRNHAIICRSRVGPARLSTNRSALVRTCLQATQAEWKALSEADRILWDQYALTVTFSGPLGNYTITGQQMFVRTLSIIFYYQMLGLIGFPFPIVTTPPSIPGLPNIGPINPGLFVSPGTGVGIFVDNLSGYNATALVRVSIPWSGTRRKNPNIWDTAKNQATAVATGTYSLVEVPSLIEDMYYFVSIRMVLDDSPYRLDTEYVFRLQAVTNP